VYLEQRGYLQAWFSMPDHKKAQEPVATTGNIIAEQLASH